MLLIGTRNTTETELRNVLGYARYGFKDDDPHTEMMQVMSHLQAIDGNVDLDIANAIYIDEGFETLENYSDKVHKYYDTKFERVDFGQHSEIATQSINTYIKWKTKSKISQLLKEPLPPSTVLFLMSVIYFKGTWKYQFDPKNTKDSEFFNEGRTSDPKIVPYMRQMMTIPFATFNNYGIVGKAVELPYIGSEITMLILLPDAKDGVIRLQRSLTYSTLRGIYDRLKSTKVWIEMPKFKLDAEYDLKVIFERIGIRSIFNTKANLTGISVKENLFVDKALHKAVIEVNEEGTEAAAVSGVSVNVRIGRPSPQKFIADHPFILVIKDTDTGMILFVGRVSQL